MGRPVYPHELSDPDFSWLVNSYRENNPQCVVFQSTCLPVVIVSGAIEADQLDCDPSLPPPPAGLGGEEDGESAEERE